MQGRLASKQVSVDGLLSIAKTCYTQPRRLQLTADADFDYNCTERIFGEILSITAIAYPFTVYVSK